MSKVIIVECNLVDKPGKTAFWGCKDNIGNKMTCWDADMAKVIIANLNTELDVTMKTSGNFTNIRAVEGMGNAPIEVNPSLREPVSIPTQAAKADYGNVAPTPSLRPLKDDSIVAQVILKESVKMYCSESEDVGDVGEYLHNASKELHAAYLHNVRLLEVNE